MQSCKPKSKKLLFFCYVHLPSLLSYQMDPLPKFDVQYWEFSNIFLYHFVFTFSTCYNLSGASIMNKMDSCHLTATFHHMRSTEGTNSGLQASPQQQHCGYSCFKFYSAELLKKPNKSTLVLPHCKHYE